ncbi:FAD-binding oxidoreductase [Bosea lathyri]|uniref:FAD/FMN-containing dehydrogenase n=1 Tax=Bosea lathyri TaxID=1036778 RepID=A0A1H5VHT3_9HYPH|nr:FAD-binding oxidoreductase [Bosea lathyri]SEF86358.1 FAD/FMN-containing dehydrogenase [Bosea lathyri]
MPEGLQSLEALLDPACIVTDPAAMAPYLSDWRGRRHGTARAVLRPRTVDQVSEIMRWATATHTSVVPQGGNTGLSGGATPDGNGDAVVLSLGRLNSIRSIDSVGNTLVADAGCILADVQRAATGADRLFPLSLGSEGSCQVGGIVATNAGGINVIRYGTVRDLTLGLEFVRADGAVIHGLKSLRKDNAGYALRDMLIGSEGTLGIVTGAAFKLFARPKVSATALCGLASPAAALHLLGFLRTTAGERISSFEVMCDAEMGLTLDLVPGTTLPLGARHPWYCFIEIADSDPLAPVEHTLADVLGRALEDGVLSDAVIAQSEAQAKAIWSLRFAVSEANRLAGASISHDTSVATADVPALIEAVLQASATRFPAARPLFVGHLGDGNIHVNLLFPKADYPTADALAATAGAVNDCIFEIVTKLGGSITAEHGIGRSLVGALARTAQPEALELMRSVKLAFDPLGILNPGAVLRKP